MNLVEIIIVAVIGSLFIIASYKVYQDSKMTKAGIGCAGCRISDSCQKAQNVNRVK